MCQKYPSVLIHPIINNLSSPPMKKEKAGLSLCDIPHPTTPSPGAISVAHVISCFDVLWFLKRVISTHFVPHAPFQSFPALLTSESPLHPDPEPPCEMAALSNSASPRRGAPKAGWKKPNSAVLQQHKTHPREISSLCHLGIWFLLTALLLLLPVSYGINV